MATRQYYSFSFFCDECIVKEKIKTFLKNSGFLQCDKQKYRLLRDDCSGSVSYETNGQMLFITLHPTGNRQQSIVRFCNLVAPLLHEFEHM